MRAGASFHVSPSFPRKASFWLCLVWLCVCLFFRMVFVLLSCFAFKGLSSDQTSESTNDSMPGVAKTATIVVMSAASIQKKWSQWYQNKAYFE